MSAASFRRHAFKTLRYLHFVGTELGHWRAFCEFRN
jgi:hypothetical protein